VNVIIDRELIAQLVIVTAIAIGGWLMFVDPGVRETVQLEHELELQAKAQQQGVGAASLDQVLQRLDVMRSRSREIIARNEIGQETTRLYSLVRDLAEQHEVTLRRLQPGRGRATPGRNVATNQLEMHFESSLDAVAGFVDAVESIDGFVRPESLTLTPLSDERVSGRYACSVLYFPLEDVVAQMEGDPNAGS
jgi:Tfp pilus assembly protein PilO